MANGWSCRCNVDPFAKVSYYLFLEDAKSGERVANLGLFLGDGRILKDPKRASAFCETAIKNQAVCSAEFVR